MHIIFVVFPLFSKSWDKRRLDSSLQRLAVHFNCDGPGFRRKLSRTVFCAAGSAKKLHNESLSYPVCPCRNAQHFSDALYSHLAMPIGGLLFNVHKCFSWLLCKSKSWRRVSFLRAKARTKKRRACLHSEKNKIIPSIKSKEVYLWEDPKNL